MCWRWYNCCQNVALAGADWWQLLLRNDPNDGSQPTKKWNLLFKLNIWRLNIRTSTNNGEMLVAGTSNLPPKPRRSFCRSHWTNLDLNKIRRLIDMGFKKPATGGLTKDTLKSVWRKFQFTHSSQDGIYAKIQRNLLVNSKKKSNVSGVNPKEENTANIKDVTKESWILSTFQNGELG